MGTAEGTLTEGVTAEAMPGDRSDGGGCGRLGHAHGWQDADEALGEHAFACAWGADVEQVMTPGRRHFQCASPQRLASDLGEIRSG